MMDDIEVTPTELYYIGRAMVNIDMNREDPPKISLMMPIKTSINDITKPYRLLMYQYANYWAVYSLGPISRAPLNVTVWKCLYDRIGCRGYSSRAGADAVVDFLSDRQYRELGSVEKSLVRGGNQPKRNSFISYMTRDMSETAICRAWFAARLMSDISRPSDLARVIDARIAEVYTKCKDVASKNDVTLHSCRYPED